MPIGPVLGTAPRPAVGTIPRRIGGDCATHRTSAQAAEGDRIAMGCTLVPPSVIRSGIAGPWGPCHPPPRPAAAGGRTIRG